MGYNVSFAKACSYVFFTLAMVLLGAMTGLFVSSQYDKIAPKAAGWYPSGISNPADGDTYRYLIDAAFMRPDIQNGVIGYGGNLVVNTDVRSETDPNEVYTTALLF